VPRLLPALALLALPLLACQAELEEGCVHGVCGPLPEGQVDTTTGDFPCDVYGVLRDKCYACHTDPPQNFAPFPLLTFEDTRQPHGSLTRWEAMRTAIETGFMPLVGSPPLDPAEEPILVQWFAGGALPLPEGQGCECDDPAACP
jgi:hypothetical protein